MKLLEVCVDSLESARNAIAGGADRLELCAALSVGGLTPSAALLRQIRGESDIPVRCLMRPRAGDFLYTPEERSLMVMQMEALKAAGANGFVIGCLTKDGELDGEALQPLLQAAEGCGLTLHRCIDVSKDPLAAYRAAWALGMDTVLTSGGAASCLQGEKTLASLLELQAAGGPTVLIGAGVNADTIHRLGSRYPNARAFHMSGKRDKPSGMVFRREGVPMGIPGLDEWHIAVTGTEAIQKARHALNSLA